MGQNESGQKSIRPHLLTVCLALLFLTGFNPAAEGKNTAPSPQGTRMQRYPAVSAKDSPCLLARSSGLLDRIKKKFKRRDKKLTAKEKRVLKKKFKRGKLTSKQKRRLKRKYKSRLRR